MSYRIAQDFEYAGKDYWRWWAWIEAKPAELDKVKEVVWILHPTFRPSRVPIRDRSSKFRLKTAGWGMFLLRAEVELVDGERKLLQHDLRLEYPNEGEAALKKSEDSVVPHRTPTVFLSYSMEDSRTAARIRDELQKADVKVLDQTLIRAGEPWKDAIQRMVAQSDGVVGLVGEDGVSSFVRAEMEAAVASAKPALAFVPKGVASVSLPSEVRTRQLNVGRINPIVISELLKPQKLE